MRLDNNICKKVKFKGKNYKINLSYTNVLKAFEVLEDKFLLSFEKTLLFINTLCPTAYKIKLENLEEFCSLVNAQFFTSKNSTSNAKTVDLTLDEDYIYASFKQAYSIDLKSDKLSWSQFVALFISLPEDTKIREVMSIRSRPIPQQTKYNGDEIKNLIKLKEFYALANENSNGQSLENGLASLFETLKQRTVM